jgi:tripartite-type tricarboxylate transporter receptor subunit TctC
MKRSIRLLLSTTCVFAAAAVTVTTAVAQDWPNRPVKLVVPFPAGGPTDMIGREVAEVLRAEFKQPVIVENRPGGNGTLGLGVLAKAPADGYTLGLVAITVAIAPHLGNAGFDSFKDFTYISNVASTTPVLVAAKDAPYSTLAELVTYAKANPGRIAYGTPGVGTIPHLAAELFQTQAGVQFNHIPYKGAQQQIQDLIGGSTQLDSQSSLVVAGPQIKAGRIKAIAVLSDQRSPQLPDTPTAKESGYPGLVVAPWFGIGGPAGLPPDVVQKVHAALVKGFERSDVQEKFTANGNVIHISKSPAEFRQYANTEFARWGKVIKDGGIKGE